MNSNPFGFGGAEVLIVFLVLAIAIAPAIFYIRTLSRALAKCSGSARTMEPGKVWLLLIPLFNLVWHFMVVSNLSRSIENEFRRRGIPGEEEPGKSLGVVMCILAACSIIPVIGAFLSLAGVICWIMYWVKISGYSGMLDAAPPPLANAASLPPV